MLSALAEPFRVRGLALANRIVMAPMTRHRCPGGVPTAEVAAYYARRAAAGVGLIITEGTLVDHESAGRHDDIPMLRTPEQVSGWRRVVRAVHSEGGRIVCQLWHVGAVRKAGEPPSPSAPSIGPATMTLGDVGAVVRAFSRTAAAARDAGFDGVEVHAAHGYLIDQFLWSRTNRRSDDYGGDLASRTRFAAEVVAAVRAAVGPDLPLFLRFSQWKGEDYDARIADTPAQLKELLTPLAGAGADVFHASTRRYWQPAFGDGLTLAGWARELTGLPAIAVGSVGLAREFLTGSGPVAVAGLDDLARRVAAGEFDLVAVGRALLADPAWAAKALAGAATLQPYHPDALRTLY